MALCFHSNNAMACHQTRGSIFTARSSLRISPLLHDKKLCAYQTVGQTDKGSYKEKKDDQSSNNDPSSLLHFKGVTS